MVQITLSHSNKLHSGIWESTLGEMHCYYTRVGSFHKVGEGVLEVRAKDPHAFETRDTRNETLLLVLEVAPA